MGPGTPLGAAFAVDFAEVRLPIAGGELQFLALPEKLDDPPLDVELRDAIGGASDVVWQAKIVRTDGALDDNSLELFAIARVDDPFGLKSGKPPLRIGQPVTGSIAGKVLTNVVALPRIAVRQLDQIVLIDKSALTLTAKTIVPLWSDEQFIIVRDPLVQDGTLLSITHLVYAPNGAKVEIIPDIDAPPISEASPVIDEAVVQSDVGYHNRPDGCSIELFDWPKFLGFAKYHLKGKPSSAAPCAALAAFTGWSS